MASGNFYSQTVPELFSGAGTTAAGINNPPSLDGSVPAGPGPGLTAEGVSLALLHLQQQLQQQQQKQLQEQPCGKRRVWIKREGSVPTTVYVDADDLIGWLIPFFFSQATN